MTATTVTPEMLGSIKLRFTTSPCGRCNGSGRYSRCSGYGDACFGCKGTGKRMSARAQKARKVYDDTIAAGEKVLTSDLRPGDVVSRDGREWRKVTEVVVGTDRTTSRIGVPGTPGFVEKVGVMVTVRTSHGPGFIAASYMEMLRHDPVVRAAAMNAALAVGGCALVGA